MRTTTPSSSLSFASAVGLALQSYLADMRAWAGGMASGYVMAVALMAVGGICILIAAGVGVAAAFHAVEVRYGIYVAYAAAGGFFCIAGLAALLAGRLLLKRPAPPVPHPRRQAQMLKQAVFAPAAVRLIGGVRTGRRLDADPVTQALAAAAAITFVGWICISRFGHRPEHVRD